jgi:threonine aldolase
LSRNFTSDNITPISAEILAAINAANVDSVSSYGGDPYTQRLTDAACSVFETEVAIYPVVTGTAANALALSQYAQGLGAVYCYEAAHIVTDECGAPEFFSGGAKLIGLPASDGKISAKQIAAAVEFALEMGVHHVKPAAISITQATEWGTVYGLAQIDQIAEVAKAEFLPLHMDGARFANALVHLNCTPAEMTWKRGIDVLSLGATKNGAMCAEAVVFFNPDMAADFERRRKRAGHLLSKMRYVSAQLLAYFEDDLWLKNAERANAAATHLAEGLRSISSARLLHPVEANEIFVSMPEKMLTALEAEGFGFYRWPLCVVERDVAIRLVTSFQTRLADVDAFLAACRRLA